MIGLFVLALITAIAGTIIISAAEERLQPHRHEVYLWRLKSLRQTNR